MKVKLSLSVAFLLALNAFTTHAQSYDILGVKKANVNNINAILENNEVKGYYSFSFLEKANKKENIFNLAILDNNLKQTYSVELTRPKKSILLESSYNGEGFCFSFIDMKANMLEYLILDKTGKTVGNYSLKISKNEAQIYASRMMTDEDSYNGSLAAVKGKGFVRFGYEKEEGLRIDIEMLDNVGKKIWHTGSHAASKKSYEGIAPFYVDDKVIIAGLTTREKMLSAKGTKYSVLFINVDNGKELFKLKNKNDKHILSAYGATYNSTSQTYFVYGEYFNLDDNLAKDDPQGLYIQEIDLTGKVLTESHTNWEKEMFTMMVKKSKGKMDKNMKIFIHKIVKMDNGKLFAIGEQYRKAVSGAGIASAVLLGQSSQSSVMKVEIHNIVVFEFDTDMKLKDLTIFEKDKTNVALGSGMGTTDANKLGYMMKLYGNFDYSYTTVSADRKVFNSTYVNYDRDKEAGSSYTVGNIAYNKDEQLVVDKVKLVTKPTYFWIKEAKPGYVAIFEYYRKTKTITLRLEKLNL